MAGDVALCLGGVLASVPAAETCLILDPPAIGAAGRVIEFILGALPAEIIYVSCNPATLARDLAILCRTSYKLRSVTPLDMFPQTAEIEAVAHLSSWLSSSNRKELEATQQRAGLTRVADRLYAACPEYFQSFVLSALICG